MTSRPAAGPVAAVALRGGLLAGLLAGLLGALLLPGTPAAAARGSVAATPSAAVLLPGTPARTLSAVLRGAVARASGNRAVLAPVAAAPNRSGGGPLPAVLPAGPALLAPSGPAARTPARLPAVPVPVPAGPTGRSPPVPAAA